MILKCLVFDGRFMKSNLDSFDDKTWRRRAQISLWEISFLQSILIAATWKNCREQGESTINSQRLAAFFFFFFRHTRARMTVKEREWMSVLNVPSPWNLRLKTLDSKALWRGEGGGQKRGRFNFRFKYKKRRIYLVCHLKTKEYIRGVLSA